MLLALFATAAPAFATNGPKLTAVGPRAAGRGGVDFAYADDGTGPATNPAGMAFVYGNRFDNNWAVVQALTTWTVGNLDGFKVEQHNEGTLFIPVPAFSFGATFDPSHSWELSNVFKLGDWGLHDEPSAEEQEALAGLSDEELTYGSRLRVGFGVFPVAGGKVKMKDLLTAGFGTPGNRRGVNWKTNNTALTITPSIAFRAAPWISFGLSLQVLFSKFELDGGIAQPSFTLRDDFELANTILSVNPQIITEADIDDAFTWGVSWRAGIMINPAEFLTIGLVYQDRTYSADYLGRVTVDATDEVNRLTNGNPGLLQLVDPAIDPSRGFASEYDLRIHKYEFPRQVGLGLALRPHRRFSIGIDYTYIGWHEVTKQFKTRLSHGSNPNLDIMTSGTLEVRVPLKFKDQHVIALGLSLLALEGDEIVEGVPSYQLMLRTGYNYAKSPIPGNTTLPQAPAITEHHISGGFSLLWGPYLEFSFAAEYAFRLKPLETGNHKGDYTLSNSTQDATILFLQFGIGVNF